MSVTRIRTIVHDNYITFSATNEESDFAYATIGLGPAIYDRCQCIKNNLIAEYRQQFQQYLLDRCLVDTLTEWLKNNPDIQSLNEHSQIFIPTGEGTQICIQVSHDAETRYISFQSNIHGYQAGLPVVFESLIDYDITVNFLEFCVDNIVESRISDIQRKINILSVLIDRIRDQDLQLTNIISIEC